MRHRLIHRIRRVRPRHKITGRMNGQPRHQFKRGVDQHDFLARRIPDPGRVRVHAAQHRVGDGYGTFAATVAAMFIVACHKCRLSFPSAE